MAINKPTLTPNDRSWPRPKLYSQSGSRYQPNRRLLEGQNMKSSTASPAIEFAVTPDCRVCTHSRPAPAMNSTLLDSVQGFLNRRSRLHSIEWRLNKDVTPASNSSHFSIGVNSIAAVGPKLDALSVSARLPAPPNSRIAAGSGSLSA